MCRLRSSDGDINGTNTITFEKKRLGGERREEERAAKGWSAGGNFVVADPCAEHPPQTCHTLLAISVSALWASTEKRVFETVRGGEWECSLPELVCLAVSAAAVKADGFSELLVSDRAQWLPGMVTLSSSSLSCLAAVICFAVSYLPVCLGCGNTSVILKCFLKNPCRGMLKTSRKTSVDCEILWTSLRQGLLVIFGNKPLFLALVLITHSPIRHRNVVHLQSVLIW